MHVRVEDIVFSGVTRYGGNDGDNTVLALYKYLKRVVAKGTLYVGLSRAQEQHCGMRYRRSATRPMDSFKYCLKTYYIKLNSRYHLYLLFEH